MPDGKAEHRRRTETGIQVNTDSHVRENGSRQFRKIPGMDPAVIADGAGRIGERAGQVSSEALCGFHDREKVHPVGACAKQSSQAASAEGEIPVEGVTAGIPVHTSELSEQFLRHGGTMKPGFAFFRYGHHIVPFIKKAHLPVRRIKSDNSLLAGRIKLALPEGTDSVRIPGKTVQRQTDAVFSEKIGNILKQHIQMTSKEPGL